jgi:hypothetical protein
MAKQVEPILVTWFVKPGAVQTVETLQAVCVAELATAKQASKKRRIRWAQLSAHRLTSSFLTDLLDSH